MAAPTIASSASYGAASQSTSYDVDLPAGISTGDLLLLILAGEDSAANADIFDTPTGWTSLGQSDNTGGVEDAQLEVLVRVADGTEGSTVTIGGLAGADYAAAICLRITGWSGTIGDVTLGAFTLSGGNTSSPVAASMSGRAVDDLVVACLAFDGADAETTTGSGTGWGAVAGQKGSAGGNAGAFVAYASRAITSAGASNDYTFSTATSDGAVTVQVAIPAPAASSGRTPAPPSLRRFTHLIVR